ncbi:MAG: endonuclease V [Desulfurococcales archaeon]|nr:endonuclease V [Desulfurococcales archaeon]
MHASINCSETHARFSQARARRAQEVLSRKVVVRDDYRQIRRIAGLDVAYAGRGEYTTGIGVAVVLSYPSLSLIDCVVYVSRVCIPYIPGLLAFREMAVLAPAVIRLESLYNIDLYVVDGHGIAHPRKLGIASHIGVVLDKPSIGVAKKRLYGRESIAAGKRVLLDENGDIIAVIVESGRGSRIYVSPGNKITPLSAAKLVASMLRGGRRLPEPTRIADKISKTVKRKIISSGITHGFSRCSDSSFHGISLI